MKRIAALVLAVLLLAGGLTACGPETVPPPGLSFEKTEGGVFVQHLTFDGELSRLEVIGSVDHAAGIMTLSEAAYSGTYAQAGAEYAYALPESYFTLRKREIVDGVLLYWGAAYGVVTEDTGSKKLYALDETLTEYSWSDLYNRALRWQQKNKGKTEGTGLA